MTLFDYPNFDFMSQFQMLLPRWKRYNLQVELHLSTSYYKSLRMEQIQTTVMYNVIYNGM